MPFSSSELGRQEKAGMQSVNGRNGEKMGRVISEHFVNGNIKKI